MVDISDMWDDEEDLAQMNLQMYGDRRPRGRIKGKIEDKYGQEHVVGVSVPVGATPDEMARIVEEVTSATNQIEEFKRKPREEQLEHYLTIAVQALYRIMNEGHTNVRTMVNADPTKLVWEYAGKISGMGGTADMALIQIPKSMYGEVDRKMKIDSERSDGE